MSSKIFSSPDESADESSESSDEDMVSIKGRVIVRQRVTVRSHSKEFFGEEITRATINKRDIYPTAIDTTH